jgi:hypothetical protein
VLVIITVAAFAAVIAASQSGAGIQASDANVESHQVLLLADSALERQLKRFATGTACDALGDDPGTVPVEASHTVTDFSTIGLGTTAYTVTLADGLSQDFSGTALSRTQCRIPVTARSNTGNVSRTIHAIVDRNLLEGPDNPTFNNPQMAGAPTGWTRDPAASYAINGGPDGTAPNCTRSAWQVKENTGGGGSIRRASGTTPVQFTLTAGSTTNITFDRRVVARSSGTCAGAPGNWGGGGSLPSGCTGGGANGTRACFRMTGTGGTGIWAVFSDVATSATVGGATCPSAYNPCNTNYQAGSPATKVSLNVTMTGATSVTQFAYYLELTNAGSNVRKEIFIDNIEATNDTAVGAAQVRVWRDCSTAVNPASCT